MFRTPSVVPILAGRFILSKSSDHFISLITWVSVVGVALGVLSLTVVTSVINGFEGELVRVITGMNGDIVFYSRGEPIRDPGAVERRIRKILPGTVAVTQSFVTELMASSPSGVAGAVLEGVDSESLGKVTAIPDRILSGRMPVLDDEVALGSSLADRLNAVEGSELRLIIPFVGEDQDSSGSPENSSSRVTRATKDLSRPQLPKTGKVRVVGIVRMGMYEYDSKFIFAPLAAVQKLLGQPGRVTSFKIKLSPGSDSRLGADRLADNFGYPFRSKDWAQLNKNLFYAIKLEKVVIAIILTVIVVVAAFNVVSTLMMMIHDKTKEIAILKAMGFRASQGFLLFCLIGIGMGTVGTAIGIAIGLGMNGLLEKTHWIHLPADIYYIGFLPVSVKWREVGLIAAVALVISFLATLYPAYRVSKRSPLDGLRYE